MIPMLRCFGVIPAACYNDFLLHFYSQSCSGLAHTAVAAAAAAEAVAAAAADAVSGSGHSGTSGSCGSQGCNYL